MILSSSLQWAKWYCLKSRKSYLRVQQVKGLAFLGGLRLKKYIKKQIKERGIAFYFKKTCFNTGSCSTLSPQGKSLIGRLLPWKHYLWLKEYIFSKPLHSFSQKRTGVIHKYFFFLAFYLWKMLSQRQKSSSRVSLEWKKKKWKTMRKNVWRGQKREIDYWLLSNEV